MTLLSLHICAIAVADPDVLTFPSKMIVMPLDDF